MRKTIGTLFVLALLVSLVNVQAKAEIKDSIGVEKKDGKRYVLHRLEAKETLYALSRKYGVSVDDIKKANADINVNELKIGQVLRVPSPEKNNDAVSSARQTTHIVIAGETLYSIAKRYNVSVDDMKKANPEAANGLNIGDELVIPGQQINNSSVKKNEVSNPAMHTVVAGETLYSISRKYNVTVDDLKSWNPEAAAGLKVGQQLALNAAAKKEQPEPVKNNPVVTETKKEPVTETKKEPVQQTTPDTVLTREQEMEKKNLDSMANIKVQPNGEFKKITETGFAEVIEGGDSDKYLALHKTAPVGTIIQVVNESNNQRIFVRVIGKLPANGLNDRVVLKISKKAFERLAGVDKKIPVTLSYIM